MQNYINFIDAQIPKSRYFYGVAASVDPRRLQLKKYRKIGGFSFDIIKKKVIFVRFNAVVP